MSNESAFISYYDEQTQQIKFCVVQRASVQTAIDRALTIPVPPDTPENSDIKEEITKRLAVPVGLEVSWVSHAGDMLTMQFGPQRRHTLGGKEYEDGAWALHVQCAWQIGRDGLTVATREDLRGSAEKAHDTARRLHDMLVRQEPVRCADASADDAGGMVLLFSQDYRLAVIPDSKVDPWSLS